MRKAHYAILIGIVAALGLAFVAQSQAQDYVLGEGDLLKVTVYEHDDLSTQARVNGEGFINFPLIGQVEAAGRTARDLEHAVTELLSDGYIVDPQVSVFVAEYHSNKVTILGEVKKPGLYELNGRVTLLEMISRAEGLTEDAGETILVKSAGSDLEVAGPGGKEGAYISISLRDLMEKGDLSVNRYVKDGDSIFITRSGFVYVLGEVNKPGAYSVEKGATVMRAIALAGGLNERAAPGRTTITRKSGAEDEEVFRAEMSTAVIPDDVISVPESFF